ncbi:hypothetical protein [Lacinutrix cladophorae]
MIKVRPKIVLKPIEKFFLEKTLELLNKKTLDTNRLKLNNPYTTIIELTNVCNDLNKGKLKSVDYAKSVAEETVKMLKSKHYLNSKTISIKYFESIIGKKPIGKKDFDLIIKAGNLLIRDNKNYLANLFDNVFDLINSRRTETNLDFEEMREFSRLIEYLFVELNHQNFSKFYLNRFITAIFCGLENLTFEERFEIVKSLEDRQNEQFEVIFGFDTTKFDVSRVKIFSKDLKLFNKSEKKRILSITKDSAKKFIEENESHLLISINVKTKDYYQALNLARTKLLKVLDLLYLGYSDKNISLIDECFIIGSKQPEKSSSLPTMYHIDGHYNSNKKLYKLLLKKVSKLNDSKINKETLNKINSAIRYLRMGGESGEIINKYINYWIGLEYLFSTYDADSHTVGRLRAFFKRCHSIIYLKRNLTEFHKDIIRLKESSYITSFDSNLEYLKTVDSYNEILKHSSSPLLKFRAEYYKKLLENDNKVKGAIQNHSNNLDWNLNRIYRIRNEIVHNAAIKEDIAVLTSHLRYYLTFIINGLIDFLSNHPHDVNSDDLINIDDYFMLQELHLSSLENTDIKMTELMNVENPIELVI